MHVVLGLLGLVLFIACVIALAAGITFAVVRLSPVRNAQRDERPADSA